MFIKDKSKYGFQETVKIVKDFLKGRNFEIFAEIDHRKNAINAGMDMQNETVLIFGSPSAGTLLMEENPEIGIELPARLLIYSTNDNVYLLYKNPEELIDTYKIMDQKEVLKKLKVLFDNVINAVS
ncbi:DUF302 domain-containing protein [Ferroplasma sp.]|uniref:DUF302 domain-containing protein n=1 Tax=Ferroplasma sp. TaxID=2591003 RepID=UPI0026052E8D|nr:DUF302 domain-containing protein [Ferroplasma sp.]MCL4453799.1 DUF302 domain-containing protein [Candidatus Thermoplasmatota archaeon]